MSDMTPGYVTARIEAINYGDPEEGHGQQDDLYLDVLRAIADGVDDPAGVAREALKAERPDFVKWYA
jgi:hypothetical protein